MSKKIERFEDFVAWQKARAMTGEIYKITEQGRFARDFGLRDQIRRAAVSVMSNIAEGFERGRATEFHQFLSIAKASCAEVRSQLYIALDAGYLTQEEFNLKFPVSLLRGRRMRNMGVQRERRSLWSRAGLIPQPRSRRAAR